MNETLNIIPSLTQDWVRYLGIAGAILIILFVVLLAILSFLLLSYRQLLSTILEKDTEIMKLMEKIEKVVESINGLSLAFVKSSVSSDASYQSLQSDIRLVVNRLDGLYEKFDKSISKVHDRIDKCSEDLAVVLANTDRCINPQRETVRQSDIEKMIEEKRR